MKTILVTGAKGFIGKHLVEALKRVEGHRVIEFSRESTQADLMAGLTDADVIYHLAGVNRPDNPSEFATGNTGFTDHICKALTSLNRAPLIIMASSVQAELENPYGLSKRGAEDVLKYWAQNTGGRVSIFRLKNVFGKWCRPNYNSVTATFCYNIAHDLPIQVNDPARELELVYIDDVVEALVGIENEILAPGAHSVHAVEKSQKVTLGELADVIHAFRRSRTSLELPSFESEFRRRLYATYLSYLDCPQFAYALDQKSDPRGSLAEFIKQPHFGQVFVSRTMPGITRGNHYHHSKTEKFFVVEGDAVVRFRLITGSSIIEHRVSGHDFKVVDIPPGYVHSIENVGSTELVTLFWASEIFDPARPDCFFQNVLP